MSNSTVQPREAKPSPTHGCRWVELDAVYNSFGQGAFECHFSDRESKWLVKVGPSDLQTFAAFQRKVADVGLWVRHSSEQERTARLQADDWKLAAENAWRAGS
jgi:hypothetical protein